MGPLAAMPSTDTARVLEHAALFRLNESVIRILHARGYDTPELIEPFLNPRLADLNSPFLMAGMRDAVERLRKAVGAGERIGIFADSDLDGITSLAVLHTLLSRFNIEPFIRYLKDDENYGITIDIIDEFHRNGVTLLVTVDSGIRDVAEIAHARSLCIDVIVTDHHEQDSTLPDAIILNPKIGTCTYPFKHLAGVGIAFKFCHAFLLSYLPSYDRRFIIITGDGDGYAASCMRNCIVETITMSADMEDLLESLGRPGQDDILLYSDESIAEKLRRACGEATLRAFYEFTGVILGARDASIESICAGLSINRRTYRREIDMLNKIFLETQLAGSVKVSHFIDSVLGLVAIGSIADVIPLVGENRVLVKTGIDRLNSVRHPGISRLINSERISARTIGWGIGPLLNTPGRIGKTELTVRFFIEKDPRALDSIIAEIKALNETRKSFINRFCSNILEEIEAGTMPQAGNLVYIKTAEIPEGYAGLVANRIADATGRPVIVTVLPGKNGIVKGSGRSRGGMEFFSRIEKLRDRFERIGGHENAFGFTAREQDVDGIVRDIGDSLDTRSAGHERVDPPWDLDPAVITTGFINDIARLEPFGSGNPEPVFITRGARFESFAQFGNGHGKFLASDAGPLTAIGWGMADRMRELFERGRALDIVYRLENNAFNGAVWPRMIILEIADSGN